MVDFLIGVDGGGTGCRAAVADLGGRLLGTGTGGAANILTDPEGALAGIRAAIDDAMAAAGLAGGALARAGVFLGLAGSNVGGSGAFILANLPAEAVVVESDALIALQGALGDGDGAIAILGTGSIFVIRSGGRLRSVGGWGFPIGDFGSGARLGQSLLAECLLAYDGIRGSSPLTERILADFGNAPEPMVEFARTAAPGDFARFAPPLFAAAAEGDRVGQRLVAAAAALVDEALDRIVAAGAERIALLGGLAPLYPRWLAERHRARLVAPAAGALAGALTLAARRFVGGKAPPS